MNGNKIQQNFIEETLLLLSLQIIKEYQDVLCTHNYSKAQYVCLFLGASSTRYYAPWGQGQFVCLFSTLCPASTTIPVIYSTSAQEKKW